MNSLTTLLLLLNNKLHQVSINNLHTINNSSAKWQFIILTLGSFEVAKQQRNLETTELITGVFLSALNKAHDI